MTCEQTEELRQLRAEKEQLLKERDELKAHCNTAREIINDTLMMFENPHSLKDEENICTNLHCFLNKLPQQSLANIQADAIEYVLSKVTWSEKEHGTDGKFYFCVEDLMDEASKLRNKGKE